MDDECRLVVANPEAGTVVDRRTLSLGEDIAAIAKTLRRAHGLSQHLRVILWPSPSTPGVCPITAKPAEPLAPPTTLTIRAQVEPLVRGGFVISGLAQPHEALAELARQRGAGLAVSAAFHQEGGCLTFARRGRSSHLPAYLKWDPAWALATAGGADPLARMEFAAALSPHLRQLLDAVPDHTLRILVCGSLANLRPAMGPLSDEFRRPVEVLDHPWPELLDAGPEGLRAEPAVWQLARAVALSPLSWHRSE